ncbi:MAG: ABC transporter substrate-binding protein [Termitinemataceae bacterium]|nr:MAG: ABC transporter substrate-binding protein [Termitinemataceae bacterium]
MKKILLLLMAAFVLPIFLFGCKPKQTEKYPLGAFDISYSGSTCGSPLSIAKLKGFYDEEGVDITLVSGVSFEDQRNALAAGKMPIRNGDFQYFPAVYNGIDVKLIGGLHEGCIKILAPIDSDILTVADLKGKTIAIDEIGGTPQSVASVATGHVGINPQTEISWKPFPNDQILQAVEKGEAQALAAWDPFATIAVKSGKYRVLVDIATDPLFAGKNCCFVFASGKLVRDNPAAVAATFRAVQKAIKWEGDNPAEAAKLLIDNKILSTTDTDLVAELLDDYAYDAHASHSQDINAKEDAVFFAAELAKIGYLPADLDAQKFVDDMYVDIYELEKAAKK